MIPAIHNGDLKMVKLLYLFIDNQQEDNELLIKAVEYNQLDIVKFLVAIGTKYIYKDCDAIQLGSRKEQH